MADYRYFENRYIAIFHWRSSVRCTTHWDYNETYITKTQNFKIQVQHGGRTPVGKQLHIGLSNMCKSSYKDAKIRQQWRSKVKNFEL